MFGGSGRLLLGLGLEDAGQRGGGLVEGADEPGGRGLEDAEQLRQQDLAGGKFGDGLDLVAR